MWDVDVLIHPWDNALDEDEWRDFVESTGFGHLVAVGLGRDVAEIVPTQFALDGDAVLLHLARPNPIWRAIEDNPRAVLTVSGDWAYIPSTWKAIGDEDPSMGIPTTYYAAVQLIGTAAIVDDIGAKAELLRRQLAVTQPDIPHADPAMHGRTLNGLRGLRLHIEQVRAKFKYGGNVDNEHRRAVAARLQERNGPADAAARSHLIRRMEAR